MLKNNKRVEVNQWLKTLQSSGAKQKRYSFTWNLTKSTGKQEIFTGQELWAAVSPFLKSKTPTTYFGYSDADASALQKSTRSNGELQHSQIYDQCQNLFEYNNHFTRTGRKMIEVIFTLALQSTLQEDLTEQLKQHQVLEKFVREIPSQQLSQMFPGLQRQDQVETLVHILSANNIPNQHYFHALRQYYYFIMEKGNTDSNHEIAKAETGLKDEGIKLFADKKKGSVKFPVVVKDLYLYGTTSATKTMDALRQHNLHPEVESLQINMDSIQLTIKTMIPLQESLVVKLNAEEKANFTMTQLFPNNPKPQSKKEEGKQAQESPTKRKSGKNLKGKKDSKKEVANDTQEKKNQLHVTQISHSKKTRERTSFASVQK